MSDATAPCRKCGEPDPARVNGIYGCMTCKSIYQKKRYDAIRPPPSPRACKWCGESYVPGQRRASWFCSRQCKDRARNARWKADLDETKAATPTRYCGWCGDPIPSTMRADARWCSKDCAGWAHRTTRKVRRRLGQTEKRRKTEPLLSLAMIGDRDKWQCQLCRKPVDKRKRWPDTKAPSLDHVIPLSVGKALGYSIEELNGAANLQLAHRSCNSAKRDRPQNEQLRLVG